MNGEEWLIEEEVHRINNDRIYLVNYNQQIRLAFYDLI